MRLVYRRGYATGPAIVMSNERGDQPIGGERVVVTALEFVSKVILPETIYYH